MLTQFWHSSDSHVVARVLRGRHNDFGILVERYLPAATAVARSYLGNLGDVDDVVQEAFISAFQKLNTLQSPNKFAGWLMTIVRNTSLNWKRRLKDMVPLDEELAAKYLPPDERAPDQREMEQMLHVTLRGMDAANRELLLLHYFAGHSLREIAAMQGITRAAAAKRLQRARESLGAQFLKNIEQKPTARETAKRTKVIMAAVVAAGAAWKTARAHGMVAALAIGAVKLAGILFAIASIAAGGLYVAPYALDWEPEPAVDLATVEPMLPQAPPAAAAQEEGPRPADEESEVPIEGDFSLSCVLSTPFGQTIGNAEVEAELVNWKAEELPPAKVQKWKTRADENGYFRFEGLPAGEFAVVALTSMMGGSREFTILRNGKLRGPRDLEMWPIIQTYGRVVDSSGAPVAGAVLYPVKHELYHRQEFAHARVAGARAISDKEGRFKFRGIFPGGWKLFVVAPGHQPQYTDYVPCYRLQATVVLPEPASITGQILDDAGKPVPNIQGAYECQERVRQPFISDSEGRYRVAALSPGVYKLKIEDSVLVPVESGAQINIEGGVDYELDIPLTVGGSIKGRVISSADQSGMPDIEILADSQTGLYEHRETKTGPGGEFILTGLVQGNWEVRPYRRGGYGSERVSVTVPLGDEAVCPDFVMAPMMKLTGVVQDAFGKGVAATVRASGESVHAEGRSLQDGAFSLDVESAGGLVTVTAQNEAFLSDTVVVDLAKPLHPNLTLRLTIPASSVIEGVIYEADGKPAFNVEIYCQRVNDDTPRRAFSSGSHASDAEGRFRIPGLSAGQYTVHARRAGNGIPFGEATVDLAEGATAKVELRAGGGKLAIAGTIYYPNGIPCPFALAILDTEKAAVAGPMGGFEFPRLGEGTHSVYTVSPGYSPTVTENVAAGTKGLQITLKKNAVVTGHVLDSTDGKPVQAFSMQYDVNMQLPSQAYSFFMNEPVNLNAPDGTFELEKVPALPVILHIDAPGYAPWSKQIDAGSAEVSNMTVMLTPAAPVTGTVRDETGQAIANAVIYQHSESPYGSPAETDVSGSFTILTLPRNVEAELTAEAKGFVQTSFLVTPGGTVPVDVVMKKAGSLRVRASSGGQPVLSFLVSAVGDSGSSTENGEAVLSDLAPGEVMLNVVCRQARQMLHATQAAIVEAGRETLVEVVVQTGSYTLEGMLLDGGEPLAEALILLKTASDALIASATPDASGAFRMEGLCQGEYELELVSRPTPEHPAARTKTIAVSIGADTPRIEYDFSELGGIYGLVEDLPPNASAYACLLSQQLTIPPGATEEEIASAIAGCLIGRRCSIENGAFWLNAEPGTYTVLVIYTNGSGGMRFSQEEVHVPEQGPTNVVLTATPAE